MRLWTFLPTHLLNQHSYFIWILYDSLLEISYNTDYLTVLWSKWIAFRSSSPACHHILTRFNVSAFTNSWDHGNYKITTVYKYKFSNKVKTTLFTLRSLNTHNIFSSIPVTSSAEKTLSFLTPILQYTVSKVIKYRKRRILTNYSHILFRCIIYRCIKKRSRWLHYCTQLQRSPLSTSNFLQF